jgi:hypothetical protein
LNLQCRHHFKLLQHILSHRRKFSQVQDYGCAATIDLSSVCDLRSSFVGEASSVGEVVVANVPSWDVLRRRPGDVDSSTVKDLRL